MISFESTAVERELARAIAKRAVKAKIGRSQIDVEMAIIATHVNGCPLDLGALMAADAFNFSHDICGIARHLDRDDDSPTGGQLLNCFRPRCAEREASTIN